MSDRILLMGVTRIEAAHIAALVGQFVDLLAATDDARADEAIARLVPDAYADDPSAADEFREATEADLLGRREADARIVLASIGEAAELADDADNETLTEEIALALDGATVQSWLRTLAAVRLVLASRLGITDEDYDHDDPRFGIYDWLGFRLNSLVEALER
jgi:hypothetical protein